MLNGVWRTAKGTFYPQGMSGLTKVGETSQKMGETSHKV